jgi:hypothetical protein
VSLTELITQGLEHVIEQYKDVPEREGDLKRGRRSLTGSYEEAAETAAEEQEQTITEVVND